MRCLFNAYSLSIYSSQLTRDSAGEDRLSVLPHKLDYIPSAPFCTWQTFDLGESQRVLTYSLPQSLPTPNSFSSQRRVDLLEPQRYFTFELPTPSLCIGLRLETVLEEQFVSVATELHSSASPISALAVRFL
jgi:hypothetical protein